MHVQFVHIVYYHLKSSWRWTLIEHSCDLWVTHSHRVLTALHLGSSCKLQFKSLQFKCWLQEWALLQVFVAPNIACVVPVSDCSINVSLTDGLAKFEEIDTSDWGCFSPLMEIHPTKEKSGFHSVQKANQFTRTVQTFNWSLASTETSCTI